VKYASLSASRVEHRSVTVGFGPNNPKPKDNRGR